MARIVYYSNVVLKEILTPKEISRLATFRYEGELREVQRAFITTLLDGKPRSFKSGATLYAPDKEKDVDVGNVEVQIKQDPTDDNNFRLHLGGKRVFQWFKEKWQALKQSVKRGFGIR